MNNQFDIITDNDYNGTARCKNCGCAFDWDITSEQNLTIVDNKLELICPACN